MPQDNPYSLDPNDGQYVEIRPNGKRRVRTMNYSESRTIQSDRNKAEIKNILARYEATGIIDHMRDVDLQYRDVSEFTDLADAMQQAKEAERVFLQLPPELRNVFENDVVNWLDAAHDPEKIEALRPQLEQLGVLDPIPAPPSPEPTPTPPEPTPEP